MNECLAAEGSDLFGDFFELSTAASGQGDIGTLSRESERDGATDAATAAGDQGLLAVEREHRAPSLRFENPLIVGTSRRSE